MPHFNAIAWGIPCQYRHKWYIVKNSYISATESILVSSTTFTQSAQKATGVGEIKQPLGRLRRSRSFKVIEFGTNRKPICDFLLVINSNLPPILHRFRDIASQRFKIATFFLTLFGLTPRRRGSPGTISEKFYLDVVRSPSYYVARKHCRKFQSAE